MPRGGHTSARAPAEAGSAPDKCDKPQSLACSADQSLQNHHACPVGALQCPGDTLDQALRTATHRFQEVAAMLCEAQAQLLQLLLAAALEAPLRNRSARRSSVCHILGRCCLIWRAVGCMLLHHASPEAAGAVCGRSGARQAALILQPRGRIQAAQHNALAAAASHCTSTTSPHLAECSQQNTEHIAARVNIMTCMQVC